LILPIHCLLWRVGLSFGRLKCDLMILLKTLKSLPITFRIKHKPLDNCIFFHLLLCLHISFVLRYRYFPSESIPSPCSQIFGLNVLFTCFWGTLVFSYAAFLPWHHNCSFIWIS
jgi:hypothetical protein